MGISVREIIEATGGSLYAGEVVEFTGVSIDSRTISDGEVFFAIKGERVDGHDFVMDALKKGRGAVVERVPQEIPEGRIIITVSDTIESLQRLARFRRMKQDIPVIGVTGSNGKTTTKEMIHSVLSQRFRTLKSEGNLNNHIGLPLSLLKLEDEEVIVLEMGMNAPGEISMLCDISRPTHGVITNIGLAHIGRLGSYEAVRDAKLEILRSVDVIIVNGDDAGLMEGITQTRDFRGRMITFGIERDVDVKALSPVYVESGTEFVLMVEDNKTRVSLMIPGMFNVYNALAAAAVGYSLGLTMNEIKKGLESYRGFSMRFEIIETARGITLINDAYNANPSSMKQAIKELLSIKKGQRRIAVLGDMYELGEYSHSAHREVLEYALSCGLDIVVTVGKEMIRASEGCHAQDTILITSPSPEGALSELQDVIKEGDVILVKGSRAMQMETVVKGLRDVI